MTPVAPGRRDASAGRVQRAAWSASHLRVAPGRRDARAGRDGGAGAGSAP